MALTPRARHILQRPPNLNLWTRPVPQLVLTSRRNLLKCAATLATLTTLSRPGITATVVRPGLQLRKLTWAGVLIETENRALFIDVIAPDEKKGEKEDILATTHSADALITHGHTDHFDKATLQKLLGEHGRLVCLRAAADRADTRGLRVQPVDLWQPIFFPAGSDDLVAFPVPAVDGWGAPQVSWVIDGGGVRLFHGGDTQWHADLVDVGRAYGPFDVAFLPINGARQRDGRFIDQGIPAVLTPSQAVAAAQLLRAKLIVPIHFGNPDPPDYVEVPDPLGEFRREASKAKIPIRVLSTGESFHVEGHSDTSSPG
jgi:L-ascorbate metabolism protein UlaG (beta-lactamase superfamily)